MNKKLLILPVLLFTIASSFGQATVGKNINQLPVASTLDAADKLPTWQGGVTKAAPFSLIQADAQAKATTAQSAAVQRANHTGTQAISTVSGLQPALDLKTNLSASSVDMPDLYDNFTRADGSITTGSTSTSGQSYTMIVGNGTPNPRISSNKLIGNEGATYYLRQTLSKNVSNIGCRMRYPAGTGSGFVTGTIIIAPNTTFLDALIHITFNRLGASLAVSTSGGVAGFVQLGSTSNPTLPLSSTNEYVINVTISGSTLVLEYAGQKLEVTDSRIGSVNGPIVYLEQYAGVAQSDQIQFTEYWANANQFANAKASRALQPWSTYLSKLSGGFLTAPNAGTVGTFADGYSPAQGNLEVSGDVITTRLLGRVGTNTGTQQPAILSTSRLNSTFANTGSSENYAWSDLLGNKMTVNGNMLEVTVLGKFAANASNKRVRFNIAGNAIVDSGSVAQNGGFFRMKVYLWKDASNSHNCLGFINTSGASVMPIEKNGEYVGNFGSATSIGVDVAITGAATNDVTILGVWMNWTY